MGLENPADLGSRGVTASNLYNSRLWWEGPLWLNKSTGDWPNKLLEEEPSEAKEERKKDVVVMATVEQPVRVSQVVDINRHSTLGKLLRVTACSEIYHKLEEQIS